MKPGRRNPRSRHKNIPRVKLSLYSNPRHYEEELCEKVHTRFFVLCPARNKCGDVSTVSARARLTVRGKREGASMQRGRSAALGGSFFLSPRAIHLVQEMESLHVMFMRYKSLALDNLTTNPSYTVYVLSASPKRKYLKLSTYHYTLCYIIRVRHIKKSNKL